MSVEFELDYDWKDADCMNADATLEVSTYLDDEAAIKAILEADDDISRDFGNDWVTFIPYKVNGEAPSWDKGNFGEPAALNYDCMHPESRGNRMQDWVTEACIDHLKRFPGTRRFEMEGVIE